MAITPDAINRLKSQLLTSGLSRQNQALFQVINQLIDAVRDTTVTANEAFAGAGVPTGGGGSTTIINNIDQAISLIDTGEDFPEPVPIPGAAGPAGAPGLTGGQGPMGAIIFPPDAEDGDIYPPMPGPQGVQGLTGSAGTNGTIGQDGDNGEDGFLVLNTILPSLVIAQAAQPASLNVTTEGTIDWFVIGGNITVPRALGAAAIHTKALGGTLHTMFDWIQNGGTIFTQNDVMTITSTAGDDTANAVLAASIASQGVNIVAGTNIGWRLVAPPSPNRISTLRIYCSVFSGEDTINVNMPFDGLSTSLTFDSGAAAALYRMLTIQYRGNGFLYVTSRLTINRASTPNIKFQAVTLG